MCEETQASLALLFSKQEYKKSPKAFSLFASMELLTLKEYVEFSSKKASTSHLLPTSETAPSSLSAGYVYVHWVDRLHSVILGKWQSLGMKVRNTSFLGL